MLQSDDLQLHCTAPHCCRVIAFSEICLFTNLDLLICTFPHDLQALLVVTVGLGI